MRAPATLLVTMLLAAAPAAAQQPAAEVVKVVRIGERLLPAEREFRRAEPGLKLPAGSKLRTGEMSSMVVMQRDRTPIYMGANSNVDIQQPPPGGSSIRIEKGRAWMQSNAPSGPVQVRTPSALAAIRGTDWEIVVDEQGRTTLTVFSGQVDLSNDLGSVSVGPNEQAEAQVGHAPVKLTLTASRDRIQWVNSLAIDPARHPGEELPAAYERLRRLPAPTVEQAVLLADMEMYRGEAAAARAALERAAARYPGNARLEAALARVALFAGDLDGAAEHARRAVAADPALAEARIALGDIERRRGRVREALEAYEEALRVQANDARAWHGMGVVESERENVRIARSHLERAIALEPAEASHHAELGTLEGFAGDLARARARLQRAIELRPHDYVALTGLGVVLLKAGEPGAALDALLRATTIEPRYARAHLYAAAAYYRLEREDAALKMLERAMELDPNDPLPHLMRGIVHLDRIEPGRAVSSARAALERIPFLKSLNQVADNQRGIANVGFPLAFMGLEAWARSAAHESYLPSWGASHLFLAERYAGEFNRRSELLQGFMANPLAFGASNRFQSLTPRPGHFGTLALRYAHSDDLRLVEPVATVNGLLMAPMPFAYFFEGIDTRVDPRDLALDLKGQTYTVALGAKPVHELGLFAYFNHLRAKARLGRPDVTGEFAMLDGDASRLDVGAHYAFDARSSVWLKAGASRQDSRLDTLASILLPQQRLFRDSRFATDPKARDLGVRHLFAWQERWEFAVGAEAARAETPRRLERDAQFRFEGTAVPKQRLDQRDVDRSASAHASARFLAQDWRVEAGLAPTRYRVTRDIRIDLPAGTTHIDEGFRRTSHGAFAGIVVKPRRDWIVRAACREWLRPASLDTLVPIAVAGIPLDDQLVFAGGRLAQCSGQVEWSPGRRTFVSLFAERNETRNLVSQRDGVLNTRADVTNLERLRNRVLTPPPKPDLLEDMPIYAEGVARRAGIALEQVVTRGLAARIHYVHTDSRNTDPLFAGRRIPYLARDQVNLGFTWAPGWHTYVQVFAVHRSSRFADERNAVPLAAGWEGQANAFIESPGKRWALELFAANLFKKSVDEVYGAVVSYRF